MSESPTSVLQTSDMPIWSPAIFVFARMTSLQRAAAAGDAVAVQNLLSMKESTPVISDMRPAAQRGYTNIVELFLDAGVVDINARDTDGKICLAFGIKHSNLVKMLLERGANTQLRALDGGTPLHCAIKGQYPESAILLLKFGADAETEDYEGQKPLDIALLDPSPSEDSIALVKALVEYGCDIGRPDISKWRRVLMASDADVVIITETYPPNMPLGERGFSSIAAAGKRPAIPERPAKPSIGIELVQQALDFPKFTSCVGSPAISMLCSGPAEALLIPQNLRQLVTSGAMVEWQWRKEDGDLKPSGRGLSIIGSLATSIDVQAFLRCYVCFEYITRLPGTEEQEGEEKTANTFLTRNERSEILWTMRKTLLPSADLSKGVDQTSMPIFRSEDFRGTIDIGWIPQSGVDFFTWYIVDLHKKWRVVFDDADDHLRKNRALILRNKGRTTEFIDNLLFDAQQWSNFRALLEIHVRKARDLAHDFKEKRYLCAEVNAKGGSARNRKNTPAAVAIEKLSKAIQRMEVEVHKEVRKLDERTKEMIELEFNLVSIYEARTSKIMGMSMKRLSWITFIFLPLMFVASLFGMNVDAITSGPHWWWVIILGTSVFILVIIVWGLLKIFKLEESTGLGHGTTRRGFRIWNGHAFSILIEHKTHRNRAVNLESGQQKGGAPEFKSPGRQWTKLKDL